MREREREAAHYKCVKIYQNPIFGSENEPLKKKENKNSSTRSQVQWKLVMQYLFRRVSYIFPLCWQHALCTPMVEQHHIKNNWKLDSNSASTGDREARDINSLEREERASSSRRRAYVTHRNDSLRKERSCWAFQAENIQDVSPSIHHLLGEAKSESRQMARDIRFSTRFFFLFSTFDLLIFKCEFKRTRSFNLLKYLRSVAVPASAVNRKMKLMLLTLINLAPIDLSTS